MRVEAMVFGNGGYAKLMYEGRKGYIFASTESNVKNCAVFRDVKHSASLRGYAKMSLHCYRGNKITSA